MTTRENDFILDKEKDNPRLTPSSAKASAGKHDETRRDERVISNGQPKKRKVLPIILIILFLFILLVIGVNMWMRGSKKSVLKARPPKLMTDKKVEKKITAKDGGSLELTSTNGYTYQIQVAPGALRQDTTIGLTPLAEAPFTYPGNPSNPDPSNPEPAEGPPDPGVDVTVDPPNPPQPPNPPNPPEPPDEPPLDPTDGNTGIEIYVFPPGWRRLSVNVESDPGQQATDMMASLGLGNVSNLISPTTIPPAPNEPARTGTTTPPKVIILIPRDGRTRIRNPSPVWANNGHNTPPEGSGTDVPEGGGTATPDDTSGKKGEDQVDQAAANAGGRCTAEFINATANVYGAAGLSGNDQAANRYGTLLDECEKEIIGYLKRLCESDRRLLRRADFTTARKLLGLTRANTDQINEVNTLESTCKGYYSVTEKGSPQGSGQASVVIESTLDASVCGYFDDLWKAKTTYTLFVDGAVAHEYNGSPQFRLPTRGGFFGTQDQQGSHNFAFAPWISGALPKLYVYGTFDSRYTVDFSIYPAVNFHVEIPLINTDCTEPPINIPLVPLIK